MTGTGFLVLTFALMESNLKKEIQKIIYYRLNLDDDKADEAEIISAIKKSIEFRGTNLWTLIFAILIASIGLNVNSTAVIIGAMLISPLMGPIMGVGLGAGIFDLKLMRYALKNLFIAVLISVSASSIYFAVTPLTIAHSELLARTTPTIWDVLIALFGGLAGIIASSRKNISNSIPGVAIATALMPPLCTAGYGIGTGNLSYFLGAFYLFIINGVFISLATFIIVRFLKFKPVNFIDERTERRMRRFVWWIAICTTLPSVYLAYRFVEKEIFRQKVSSFINSELKMHNLYVLHSDIDPKTKKIDLVLYGETGDTQLLDSMQELRKNYGLSDAILTMKKSDNTPNYEATAQSSILFEEKLKIQSAIIAERERQQKIADKKNLQRAEQDLALKAEYEALFGKARSFAISKLPLYLESTHNDTVFTKDTVLLLYVEPIKRPPKTNQIAEWLKVRYNVKDVKVVIN